MVELNREFLVEKYGKEKLFNLTKIELERNQITKIDSNTFKNLTQLGTLYVYFNEIEEIDERLFESLSNLEHLSFHNNRLKRIDSNTFKNLTQLETLWLGENEIEKIDVRSFESLSNLKFLDLSKNKLKEIDRKCFEPLKSIEYILLYENVGLNVLSFIIDLNELSKFSYDREKSEKLKKYGFISEWNTFLQQFPDLGNKKYFLIVNHYIFK